MNIEHRPAGHGLICLLRVTHHPVALNTTQSEEVLRAAMHQQRGREMCHLAPKRSELAH